LQNKTSIFYGCRNNNTGLFRVAAYKLDYIFHADIFLLPFSIAAVAVFFTSEHVRCYFLVFLFLHFLVVVSVR